MNFVWLFEIHDREKKTQFKRLSLYVKCLELLNLWIIKILKKRGNKIGILPKSKSNKIKIR